MQAGLARDAAGVVEGYEVFIKGLPYETDPIKLREYFAEAGEVVGDVRLQMDNATGQCKGIGWLTFASEAGMTEACGWSGSKFEGRSVYVEPAKQFHTGIRPSVQAPGTHTPALCEEVVSKMVMPNTGGVYVDGTFGRGGHSKAMLAKLSPAGRLHAFDMDPEAIAVGRELEKADSRFTIHHAPFSSMKKVLKRLGVRPAGVFFDLGISSPQFDDSHRGFRPETDGPLDLRFDQTKGIPASEFLLQVTRDDLAQIITDYGETADFAAARRIADVICLARSRGQLPTRTREFAALVAQAKGKEYQAMHPAKMTFQALRVHLNDEFGEMRRGMQAAFDLLGEGGRIGLLTWKHSECAIVVDMFRSLEAVRDREPLVKWYREQQQTAGAPPLPDGNALEMDDVVRPSQRELAINSRSRSALLHVLRKRKLPLLAKLEQLAYSLPAWNDALRPVVEVEKRPAEGEADETKKKKKKKVDSGDTKVVVESAKKPIRSGLRCVEVPSGECGHCGGDHTTKQCIFGVHPGERFIACCGTAPHTSCFWRRFIVPLGSADATAFDASDPRGSGRADVGVRCVSAGLFRSQGLRHSTQVCLSFEASGHSLEVSGSLCRGLVPDEPMLAGRLKKGLDALLTKKVKVPDPIKDPEGFCKSEVRGLEARKCSTLEAITGALQPPGRAAEGRVVLFVLAADGMPVAEACRQLRDGKALSGVVTLVGDHRGISDKDTKAYIAKAEAAGAEVLHVSLGGHTLLASHAITILQHYFDEQLHRCEVASQVDYGRGR